MNSQAQESSPSPWKWRWSNIFLRTRYQLAWALLIWAFVTVIWLLDAWPASTLLDSPDSVASILLGMGSVLALVSSIMFGFLLHEMQSVGNEKRYLYARFKEGVKALRSFLDELNESGTITDSYDFHFGLVEELTIKKFPVLDWSERLDPLVNAVIEEQREELEDSGEFGRVLRGFAYRVNDIEENVSLLFENWLRHLLVRRTLDPVVKAFYAVAAVIVGLSTVSLFYEEPMDAVLAGFTTGLAVMTFLLVVELAIVATRESREFYEAVPESDSGETEDADSATDAVEDVG